MTALFTAELGAAVLAYTLFIVVYAVRRTKTPWHRSAWGRMIMFSHVATDMLLTWSLLGLFWPTWPDRVQIFAVLLALLIVAGSWQLVALVRELVREDAQ